MNLFNESKSTQHGFLLLAALVVLAILGAVLLPARGSLWQSVGPGGGGMLTDVRFDPNNQSKLFAAMDCGGVRVSEDQGKKWTIPAGGIESFYGAEIEETVIHPKNSKIVLLAAWTGIYRSSNGGKSWTKVLSTGIGNSLRVATVAFDALNPNTVYAGSGSLRESFGFANVAGDMSAEGKVWVSSDAGSSWKLLAAFPDRMSIYSILIDGKKTQKQSDNELVLSTNRGIWKSVSNGTHFQSIKAGVPENLRQAVASPVNPTRVWATAMNDGVYQSDDFGSTWRRVGPPETHSYHYIAVDPAKRGVYREALVVSAHDWHGIGGVWQGTFSSAGSLSWKKIFPSPGFQEAWNTYEQPSSGDVAIGYPNGKRTIVLASIAARLYRTQNDGVTWQYLHTERAGDGLWKGNGFELMIPSTGAVDARNGALYVSYIDMGTFKSMDAGASWKQLKAGGFFAGGNAESLAVNPLTGEVFVSVDSGKVLASLDGGETFSDSLDKLAYQFAFGGGGEVYAAISEGVMKRVRLNLWDRIGEISGVNSVVLSHNILYAGNAEGVWKFEEGSWKSVASAQGILAGGIVAHPTSQSFVVATKEGLIAIDERGNSRTLKGGSWEAIAGVGTTVYAKNRENGIWRSTDFGNSWTRVTDNAFQDGYERGLIVDPRNPNTVYYGTQCMGLFKREF